MNTLTLKRNLETTRNRVLIGSIIIAIAMLIAFSTIFKGVYGGYIWSFSLSALFLVHAFINKDKFMFKVIIFSYVAGFTELIPDYWLVHYTETLFYPDQLKIFSSPSYMPFAWSVVLIQLGYIGWLLWNKFGKLYSALLMAVIGALFIPMYEHWAINAEWWYYANSPMLIGEIPYYIMLAEGILMLTIPAIFDYIANSNWTKVIVYGIVQGIVMWLACIIAWYTIG